MMNIPITLYEFGDWSDKFSYQLEDIIELEKVLIDVWKTRLKEISTDEKESLFENEHFEESEKNDFQPFLNFNHRQQIRARNWIGFIQNKHQLIEIYPKIFKNTNLNKESMLKHIFFWMDYCIHTKIPHVKAGLSSSDIDRFPELIIYLMASHIKEVVEEKPLSLYQEVEESLQMPRGRLNFQRYINNSLVKGSWQNLECDHELFIFDNKVNRIIKYCVRLLDHYTQLDSNKHLIRDILFILDEVEDIPCNIYDLQQIKLNTFFEEYHSILEYCRMILEQQMYNTQIYELQRWTMLFPMERLFEDFIAGFIDKKFSTDWIISNQKSEMYVVDVPRAFRMKHDIFLEKRDNSGKTIIIDTKYKIRENINDNKFGVSQADIYQMITYAVKRNCNEVFLLYPCSTDDCSKDDINTEKTFYINYADGQKHIHIKVVDVPFWSNDVFDKVKLEKSLELSLTSILK